MSSVSKVRKKSQAQPSTVRATARTTPNSAITGTAVPPFTRQKKAARPRPNLNLFKQLSPFTPLLILLVVGTFPPLVLPQQRSGWSDFTNIFLGLTIEALPFLLMGALVAATLASWNKRNSRLSRIWKRLVAYRGGAIVAGVGLGFALPVCECGTASIARQVTREGAPVTMSLVFLLAAPIINPVTILVTWIAFGGDWSMVFGRVGLGLALSIGIGLLFSLHPFPNEIFKPGLLPPPGKDSQISGFPSHTRTHTHVHSDGESCHTEEAENHQQVLAKSTKVSLFINRCFLELIQSTRVALPGISLAAAFQAYVTPRFFLDFGQGAVLSVVMLILLATLMSVCSSVDAFVALSFTGLFPVGAVLAFLVFGPLINLKSLFLFRLVLRPSTVWLITILCFCFVLLAGVIINLRLA